MAAANSGRGKIAGVIAPPAHLSEWRHVGWDFCCVPVHRHRRGSDHQRGLKCQMLEKWQEILVALIAATLPVMAGAGLAMALWHWG